MKGIDDKIINSFNFSLENSKFSIPIAGGKLINRPIKSVNFNQKPKNKYTDKNFSKKNPFFLKLNIVEKIDTKLKNK